MAQLRSALACTACGHPTRQWVGRCPSCDAWGTVAERVASPTGAAPVALSGTEEPQARLSTGFDGVDRVLGGGLVPGSVVLLAGEPGIGKSTLLLQLFANLCAGGHHCLIASGEESRAQVAARARRLGLASDAGAFVAGREVPALLEAVRRARPRILVLDSIQTIRDPEQPGLPGGPSQVRACADALIELAKTEDVTVVVAGQVTKEGDIAGPKTLEHAVDVVCSFGGDSRTGLRIICGGKNRFGPEGEVAWFEMTSDGLKEVDPSAVVAPSDGEVGAATALAAAGRGVLAVEIQALAVPSEASPRRHVSGLDALRFGLVAAVVDRAVGLPLARAELYAATPGGLRIDDPTCDLAIAAALASTATGVPPPPHSAFSGEVSLTGAVRPPPNLNARLAAAATRGVRIVFCAGEAPPSAGVEVVPVRHLREALLWAGSVLKPPS